MAWCLIKHENIFVVWCLVKYRDNVTFTFILVYTEYCNYKIDKEIPAGAALSEDTGYELDCRGSVSGRGRDFISRQPIL